jgi:hypothetical protein
MNGLKLILDAESFDYAFTDRSPLGFRIAISDARDQAAILQESSNVYPGVKKNQIKEKLKELKDHLQNKPFKYS